MWDADCPPGYKCVCASPPSVPPPAPPPLPPGERRQLGEVEQSNASKEPRAAVGAELDEAAETAAEADAEVDLGESMQGPLAHPRPGARRLLFGGLQANSGGGGTGTVPTVPYPPALPHGLFGQWGGATCFCMINDEASRTMPVNTV